MAQKLYEESNIQAIANAIRGKNGLTTTYKTSEMAAAITAIESGSDPVIESLNITSNGTYTAPDGINGYNPVTVNVPQDGSPPESEFVLSDDCDFRFAGAGRKWIMDNYGYKYTTSNISRANLMFKNSDITNLPDTFVFNFTSGGGYCAEMFRDAMKLIKIPTIDFAQTRARDAQYMFENCHEVKEIGTLKNMYASKFTEMFRYCYNLRYLPTFENLQLNTDAVKGDLFSSSYSLREIPLDFLQELIDKSGSTIGRYGYDTIYYLGFRYLYALDEITLPVYATLDNNVFAYTFTEGSRLKNIKFALQEDGTPYVMNWKTQTINLSKYIGYSQYSIDILRYNSGITADKEVKDDTTYQALKNNPDWFTCDVAYSRYNHDSAVATINSLPDTSAYLATAGGTNTIKFNGASGSATDGGAINTLTQEEIAVATAKGWTCSFV